MKFVFQYFTDDDEDSFELSHDQVVRKRREEEGKIANFYFLKVLHNIAYTEVMVDIIFAF